MKRIALIVGVLVGHFSLASSAALADSAGPIQYQPPWPSYPGKAPGAIFQDEASSAQIIVEGPYELTAEAAAAKAWPSGGKVDAEYEVTVAGNPGYMLVRKKGKQLIASAATVVDGAAYVFTVVASKADYDAAVEVWGAMVDSAWIGAGAAPAEPAWEPTYESYYDVPADSGDGGYARSYPVTLHNGASDCTAHLTIDGQSQSISAGDTVQIQLTAGNHTIGWTNRDGTSGEYTYNVPDLTEFTASCKKSKKGQSASREEAEAEQPTYQAPADQGSRYSAAELQQAAGVWLDLYYTALNFMSYSDLFPNHFVMTGMAEDLAAKAATNADLAAELMGAYGSQQVLVDQWNAGGDAEHYQLQRASAQFAINVAGHDGLSRIWGGDCSGSDDPVGCWIQQATDQATQYRAANARQQQALRDATARRIGESSTNTFIFNGMMNSPGMTFTPTSW